MRTRLLFMLWIFFLFFGCEPVKKLTATKIKDILDHPRSYENKEVTIYGTLASAS